MTREQEKDALDELLCMWHQWQQSYRPVRSWKGKALVVGDYNPGRHRNADDGTLDEALDEQTMRAMDFAVDKLPEVMRAAIHQEARNLTVGTQVFISPRLPGCPKRRQEVVAQARERLAGLLRLAGVL